MIDIDDDPCSHQVASLLMAILTQWRVTMSRRSRRRRRKMRRRGLGEEAGRLNLR